MTVDTKYIVGGYTVRPHPFDARGQEVCDWFAVNRPFDERKQALKYIADHDARYRRHGKQPIFTFREERVVNHYSSFRWDSIPVRIWLERKS